MFDKLIKGNFYICLYTKKKKEKKDFVSEKINSYFFPLSYLSTYL